MRSSCDKMLYFPVISNTILPQTNTIADKFLYLFWPELTPSYKPREASSENKVLINNYNEFWAKKGGQSPLENNKIGRHIVPKLN